ncbi:MAG: DUF58 domain-containing protein [Acidimicrobiia bacterium]
MLTRTGIAVLVVGACAVVAGLYAGFPELCALGAACMVPVLVARVRSRRPPQLAVSRLLSPDRVQVGEPATSLLSIRNDSSQRTRRIAATETIAGDEVTVHVPALAPGEIAPPLSLELPTHRRGLHPVGPLRFGRPDPFGFTRSVETYGAASLLTVHPRLHRLDPLGAGRARDLDGPTSDLAREGGVAFHGLRTYVPGDDVRLIDWRATARSATTDLYIRQHVETVRPDVDVLVHTAADGYTGDAFDLAMEVAASIVASSLGAMHPVRLRSTATDDADLAAAIAGQLDGLQLGPLLDALAAMQPCSSASLPDAVTRLGGSSEPGHSLVLITGDVDDSELAEATEATTRYGRVIAIRCTGRDRSAGLAQLGRVSVLTVSDGHHFADQWNGQLA